MLSKFNSLFFGSPKPSSAEVSSDYVAKTEQWTSLVKATLAQLPYIESLLVSDKDCIFGSFLQTIYENMHLTPEELIHLHFVKFNKDIDIRTFVGDISSFFQQVVEAGGSIEFAGTPYCTKQSRMDSTFREFKDIDLKNSYNIPQGNYWVYIKTKDNSWFKYDISYRIPHGSSS